MHALPDYGIDAPGVVRAFAVGGVVLLFGGTITAFVLQNSQPMASGAFFRAGLWWGGSWLLTATIMFWSSRVGKLRVRDRLMGSFRWTGEEQVLDVGAAAASLSSAPRSASPPAMPQASTSGAPRTSPPTGPILLPRMPAPKECSIGYN